MKSNDHTKIKTVFGSLAAVGVLFLLTAPVALSQDPRQLLDDALKAHHVQGVPTSVQMTGRSTRGETTQPIKVTATREEETLTEYGEKKIIASRTKSFEDDGTKVAYAPTLKGFGQLDITGVFFLAQLSQRPIQITTPREAAADRTLRRIHVRDNRSQKHFGRVQVNDEFDLTAG